jgi:hypothetical protein
VAARADRARRGVRTPRRSRHRVVVIGAAAAFVLGFGSVLKQRQMRLYESYLAAISERLRLRAPTKEVPCYFLNDSGQTEEVRPKSLARHVHQYLDRPANCVQALDLYLSQRKARTISRESIDALMGHWWRGEEPWRPFSSFSYAEFRKE